MGPSGLYNDCGYVPLYNSPNLPTKDEVLAFHEDQNHDAALEDLVALIHSEVKRRGGIYKIHVDGNKRPMFKAQLYDYLWVGEGVGRIDKTREETKDYPPYVVPCFDFNAGGIDNEDEPYLHGPYVQFPLLMAGRPFTGERGVIPGVRDTFLRRRIHIFADCAPCGSIIRSTRKARLPMVLGTHSRPGRTARRRMRGG